MAADGSNCVRADRSGVVVFNQDKMGAFMRIRTRMLYLLLVASLLLLMAMGCGGDDAEE